MLMLGGSIAVGGAAGYLVKGYIDGPRLVAQSARSEPSLRKRAYDDLGLSEVQRAQQDSLIDLRNKLVNEAITPGRNKADSIRAVFTQKQMSLLTSDQRAIWDAQRKAFMEKQQRINAQRQQGGDRGRPDSGKGKSTTPK